MFRKAFHLQWTLVLIACAISHRISAQPATLEIRYSADTCFRGTIAFSVQTNLMIEKIIRWDFSDSASGTANSSTLYTPSHQFTRPGVYTISCVLEINCSGPTDPNNPIAFPCFYTDTIYTTIEIIQCKPVEERCKLYFPNAFTPNGDAKNETFHPSTSCLPEAYELVIFNKWGQAVFSTPELKDAWDGRHQGVDCSAGVYAFYVRYAFPSHPEKRFLGYVTLVR